MEDLKVLFDEQVALHNNPDYIKDDPICIPHRFTKKQDIEIAGFWVAMLAWGRRQTIINKGNELMQLMDNSPYDFIVNHQESDRRAFEGFKHRTFQAMDTLYFLEFLQYFYQNNDSLEDAFTRFLQPEDIHVGPALIGFHDLFFSLENAPQRTRKHIATPKRNSACKRLNMFLRWMVRQDNCGVDFGIWKNIKPSQLLIPLDVHVDKTARHFGLLTRKQTDWKALLEIMEHLRKMDPKDPGKYDYALFLLSINGELR